MNKNVYRRNNTFPLANGGGIPYYQGVHGYAPSNIGTDGFFTRFDLTSLFGLANVSKVDTKKQLNIYPNPAQNSFYVHVTTDKAYSLTILDLTGRLIYEKYYPAYSTIIKVNAGHVSSGYYIIQINSTDYQGTAKLIKQ